MKQAAHVTSIQALGEFKAVLSQFSKDTHESLEFIAREIRRFQEWLGRRQQYWHRQVESREESVHHARHALEACLASDDCECREYEYQLSEAYHALREAEAELANVRHWRNVIEQAIHDYQRQANRLANHLQTDVPQAGAFLTRKIATLDAYQHTEPISGSGDGVGDSSLTIGVSPAQVASARVDSVLNTVKTASLLEDLTHVALHGIDWLARHTVRRVIGDAGEDIAAYLLSEQCGFQEVPFDQPHQGFDRVFSAPGLPLIIVESKARQDGAFHLSDTNNGEQGSPEWITAQVDDMTNPDSRKWSSTNERIAQTIKELGAENIPVITVVTQTETGTIDLYYRAVGSNEWQKWDRSVPLAQVLRGSATKDSIEWVNTGFHNLPVETLMKQMNFNESHVQSPADFQKVPYDAMVSGMRRLQDVVLPAVQNGATSDDFSKMDAEQGLMYEHGYRRIYDAFYGDDCIRVNKSGDSYTVINGVHRLFVAKELGIATIPVQVVEQSPANIR